MNIITSSPTCLFLSDSFPEPQPAYYCSEEPCGRSEEERALSSEGQRSPGVTVRACTPSPPPPPSPPAHVNEKATPKLFSPSRLTFTVRAFLTLMFSSLCWVVQWWRHFGGQPREYHSKKSLNKNLFFLWILEDCNLCGKHMFMIRTCIVQQDNINMSFMIFEA